MKDTDSFERAPREVLDWLQGGKISRLAAYACRSVPFYRRRFEEAGVLPTDIRSAGDIAKLPLTDAAELAACYPFGLFSVSKDMQSFLRMCDIPDGGIGRIAVAYTAGELAVRNLCISRAFDSVNAKTSDTVLIASAGMDFSDMAMLVDGIRAFGAAAVPVPYDETERQLDVIRELGADILCCRAETALDIGKRAARRGYDPSLIRLRAVFLCGGSWSESDRAAIESLLDVKAYAMEGFDSVLAPGFAWECAMQDGLHVPEDIFYAEAVDPDTGKPVPEGTRGELVITPLYEGAFPLIRLRTHMFTSLSRFACACGRTSVRISRPSPGGPSADGAPRRRADLPENGGGRDPGAGEYTDYSDFSFLSK